MHSGLWRTAYRSMEADPTLGFPSEPRVARDHSGRAIDATPSRRRDHTPHYVFVLERGLGHATHSRSVEVALASCPDTSAHIVNMVPGADGLARRIGARNWALEASLTTRRALSRELAENAVDAIYIHTQAGALLSAGIMRSVPTVISLDSTPLQMNAIGRSYNHPIDSAPVERVKTAIVRRALHAASAIVAWSGWAADSVITDYGVPSDRVSVLHPGVDLTKFHPYQGYSTGRDTARILFVGGDFERKGGRSLLDAVAKIEAPLELDIVTKDPPRELPPGLPIRVHVGLNHDSPLLYSLFREADIFCMPSLADCFGLVFAEALACGVPIVASDVGGVSEMVIDGVTGSLVPPGDTDRLASALARLTESPTLRREMAENCVRLARSEHDAAANYQHLLMLIASVARVGSPSRRKRAVR